jgi:hypothetical protein
MKYFTPDLLERLASPDEKVADAADAEWEGALVRWRRHWQKIRPALPEAVRRFEDQHVCLHDAQVLSMAGVGETFVVVVRREPPSPDVVVLTFTLDAEPVITRDVVPGHGDAGVVTWLYEEWDLDRSRRCWFEVLLSNGWSLRLRFRDFQFLVLRQLVPAPADPVSADGPTTMPRSA